MPFQPLARRFETELLEKADRSHADEGILP